MEKANEFIEQEEGKPILRIEDVFQFAPTDIHLGRDPKGDMMFTIDELSGAIDDAFGSWIDEQNKLYPNPEFSDTCHPAMDEVLATLDAIETMEKKQTGDAKMSTKFSIRHKEQVIQTTTIVTIR